MTGLLVAAVDIAVYVVPTDAPEADGTLAWDKTTIVVATARAGGERGLGWSYASAGAQTVITEMLADVVTGRDAFDIPGMAEGSGGFTSYDDSRTRQQLIEWAEKERIPRVKIKIGESWGAEERRDLNRAELAREVIGPNAELYVDANGGYSVGQAVRVADELAAIEVSWFEEPVSSQDLVGLATVRDQVRPDVAAGEYSWFLRGAALAAAHNLQVCGHCAPNLHAHVGAAVPNLRHPRSGPAWPWHVPAGGGCGTLSAQLRARA